MAQWLFVTCPKSHRNSSPTYRKVFVTLGGKCPIGLSHSPHALFKPKGVSARPQGRDEASLSGIMRFKYDNCRLTEPIDSGQKVGAMICMPVHRLAVGKAFSWYQVIASAGVGLPLVGWGLSLGMTSVNLRPWSH